MKIPNPWRITRITRCNAEMILDSPFQEALEEVALFRQN